VLRVIEGTMREVSALRSVRSEGGDIFQIEYGWP
jgi:hypothetical protein